MGGHNGQTGLPGYTRWMTSWIKLNQVLIGNPGPEAKDDPYRGLSVFTNHRQGIRKFYRFSTSELFGKSLPIELEERFLNKALASWVRMARFWPTSEYPRSDDSRDDWGLPSDRPEKSWVTAHGMHNAARNHYNTLIFFDNSYRGTIKPKVMHKLAKWGSDMWKKPKSGSPPWSTWYID